MCLNTIKSTFYSGEERLVRNAFYADKALVFKGERTETFNIASDINLWGETLTTPKTFFSLTWLKMKFPCWTRRLNQLNNVV